ncbi:MAG: DUF3291 domain-containing protein [Candidatus Latescibacteria bacterium]|nr:DUF3291 domain-containing protein [Candidatus Latescibacterota bacterium]
MARIAFYTFAVLRESDGHEQVQGFVDRAGAAFAQAEQSEGFIDRARQDASWGPDVASSFFDEDKHAGGPATLSLWTDLESVCAFAYRGVHGEAFQKRRNWFVKPEWPTYVAWWVDDDHTPTPAEACQRQKYIHDHGPSAHAFNFKQPFDEKGQPMELDRDLIQQRMKSNETRMT